MRPKVYIAGPITDGGRYKCSIHDEPIKQAKRAANLLIRFGFAPLCPQLTVHLEEDGTHHSHSDWMDVCLPWVEASDVVLRMPGKSSGADTECHHAREKGIPVVYWDGDTFNAVADDILMVLANPETVLQEAQRIVYGARGRDYGHPLDNHTCTSSMVRAYLGRKYGIDLPLDAEDTAVWNILQKISREANKPGRDNAVDGCGYFANIMMIRDERMRRLREDVA